VDELSPVSQLLKKARRRSLFDLVLDQAALAISIAMAGAILLMLTGTSLLEWYWIALLAIASLAVGLYRLRSRVPSEYRMAQRIDWKMNLADALSTATHFASAPDGSARQEEICAQQRHSAEQIASTIDPRVAVPFTRSRFAWPAAGLALVACGLFAVRYAVTGTMSLEPSLVKMAYDTFFGNSPQQQAKNNIRKSPTDPNSPLEAGNPDAPTTQNDQVPESQMESVETPDVNNSAAADQSKEAAKGEKTSPEDSQGDNGEKGEKGSETANQDEGNQDKKDSSKSDKGGDKSKDGKQDAKNQNANNENSSMLDKLKDAMANMLNKMKSAPPKEAQSAQNSQDSKSGAQEKGQKSAQNQKGSQSDSQDADAQSDQQQQQGDKSEQKQSANAKSGDKSQDKNNSPDAKSGIGSSDGDKAAREAEQLAAMGKISEILGKRAANVTGEVMVEVGSTKQQLKTPWAQKQATHIEAGSEIHRDEVPLMYQQFVQQYFEEIRKGSDPGIKPGAAKPVDSKSTQKTPSP
jgi:hypothetical protein